MSPEVDSVTLSEAVAAHVHAGDSLHLVVGHTRWSAGAFEIVRQFWKKDPAFELVMLSLSSLGTLFFRGDMVRRVVTGYSGDTFPNFTPNPVFASAYRDGRVEVEHWSFLTFAQRLEAAARGLPAVTTRSLHGSSMADNAAYSHVDTEFGEVGLLAPLQPDVAVLHAPVADRAGNVAIHPPLLEGVWGALAARRGAIVTVERIVENLKPWAHLVRIPAHRTLAVVEAPLGAHPGGLFTAGLPVSGYGEDYDFWVDVRNRSRRDDFDDWIREWVLDVEGHRGYVKKLGRDRIEVLLERADRESWRQDRDAHPVDAEAPVNAWETAAAFGARYLVGRVEALDADAVLAGAGVANLAAWLACDTARRAGREVHLTAEIGLWGYEPTPADPFVLNHRNFPTSSMLGDADMVLGTLVGGAGTTTVACLGGAQVDRFADINSTLVPDGPFLVGSGGGNDTASTCTEAVVVATLNPKRTPPECGYVTSPGRVVRALVTDLGILEKPDLEPGTELVLTAVPEGDGSLDERIARAQAACGWDLSVADDVSELSPPTAGEVRALRAWDPQGWFLRPD